MMRPTPLFAPALALVDDLISMDEDGASLLQKKGHSDDDVELPPLLLKECDRGTMDTTGKLELDMMLPASPVFTQRQYPALGFRLFCSMS